MSIIIILSCSIILQISAAWLAIQLIPVTRVRIGWISIALSFVLMAIRRTLSLYGLILKEPIFPPHITEEKISLVVSVLIFIGLIFLKPVFSGMRASEDALKVSEERFRNLVQLSPDGIVIYVDGKLVFANSTVISMMRAESKEDLIGRDIFEFIHPDFHDVVRERMEFQLKKGEKVPMMEEKLIRLDNTVIDVEVSASPFDSQGKKAIQVVIHDLTDRKETERKLKEALSEKELLLREMHHRIKNNLQIISSLINIQAINSEEEDLMHMFKETQSQIRSIAFLHELLYQSGTHDNIKFNHYMSKIVQNLIHTYKIESGEINLVCLVDDVSFDIDTTISCGLLINELVSNSLKHAFPDQKENSESRNNGSDADDRGQEEDLDRVQPEITIKLNIHENKTVELKVSDNGSGFKKDMDPSSPMTLGMQLINALTEQLEGSVDFSDIGSGGSAVTIRFPYRNITSNHKPDIS